MQNSLARRLTYRITAVVLAMMAVIAVIVYVAVREYMVDEARQRYQGVLLKSHQELRRRLSDVYVAATNNLHDIERDIDDPDRLFGHVERIVRLNPNIVNCALLFTPDYYPDKGRTFAPFATRDPQGTVCAMRIDSVYNGYADDQWYRQRMASDKADWTDPYFESPLLTTDVTPYLLTTYAVPVHDRAGRRVALLCADLSLEWLRSELMEDVKRVNKKFERNQKHQSYSFVIGRSGQYIIHPDKERMLKDTLDLHGTLQDHKGTATAAIDGVPSWIYYRYVKYVDWTMAIAVPDDVILLNGRMLNITILAVMVLGLLVIYLFCRQQIRKTTQPLHRFALSAEEVALGNFSSTLPEVDGSDEVRQLHDAFANMQTSLTIYVDELQKTTAQKTAIERDLSIARNIQMAMLPKLEDLAPLTGGASPQAALHAPLSIHASLTPAKAVGGDFYDVIWRDNRLYFCMGDVSGKGVPASLVMAMACGAFRLLSESEQEPEGIVRRMNSFVTRNNEMSIFITFFVGVLDLGTGRLRYCNAGHKAPMICQESSVKRGESGVQREAFSSLPIDRNLPVGAMSDWSFTAQETVLAPGTILFLYTDGLTEAEDSEHHQFGKERMGEVLQAPFTEGGDVPHQLIDRMTAAVQAFVGDTEQSDDLTMLALCYQGQERVPQPKCHAQRALSLPCDVSQTPRLTEFVKEVCRLAGCSAKQTNRICLVVEEAVVNVMNYAYAPDDDGRVDIEAVVADGSITVTITDSGQPFDPTEVAPADTSLGIDERPIGGLGVHLMRRYTDSVSYRRCDGKNVLTMRWNEMNYKL